MRETKDLEFKETVTNTFLKTVSAYANYGTGKIEFGRRDDGSIAGIKDVENTCLNIENMINDSIKPAPDFSLTVNDDNIITLTVKEGNYKPYFYKSKAYKRNDSATIEVDTLELTRLILEGQNKSYDSLASLKNKLEFKVLEEKLKSKMGVEKLTKDLLITLELYNKKEGYTIAGELLSDKNNFPGIDMVRFGEDINTFLDRVEFKGISILSQYDEAIAKYKQYYQYEVIDGAHRKKIEKIPEKAFREAIANALVHRTWDINADIKVSMFDDRIEIASPGSIPRGLTKKEYMEGQISLLRNPIIGNVFFRLGIIERFGTGIQRIFGAYKESKIKPVVTVYENSINILLPISHTELPKLKKDEESVYERLVGKELTSSELMEFTGFGKTKVIRIINSLLKGGYIVKIGNGRGTKYSISDL